MLLTSILAITDPTGGLLPIIAMVVIFYFVVMRPMRNEEKARRQRLDELKKGDKIVFGGGMFGRISNIDDGVLIVEVADKVKVKVLKSKVEDMQDTVLENLNKQADDKGGGGGLLGRLFGGGGGSSEQSEESGGDEGKSSKSKGKEKTS
jgi:preprotein translocase subunit YajC